MNICVHVAEGYWFHWSELIYGEMIINLLYQLITKFIYIYLDVHFIDVNLSSMNIWAFYPFLW